MSRYVVYGAGAVGGTIGARLFQAGHDVILIARGRHLEAIRQDGLTFRSPNEAVTLPIPVAGDPSEISPRDGDVVLLTMKTQDTEAALADLLARFGSDVPVVCVQNGVENERLALRRFARVYAVPVMLPATHMEPGTVQSDSKARSGVLDIGRYPEGSDAIAEGFAADIGGANFSSRAEPQVMRRKYRKLMNNLNNAIELVSGRPGDATLRKRVRDEALACFEAAGIEVASAEEELARRADHIQVAEVAGASRAGSSTWQSMVRGRPLEVDYLNGEICLLGRLHGVPTPANALIQELARQMAAEGRAPGSLPASEVLARIGP